MRAGYMEVTKDEYSLPVAVADSAYELAALRKVRVTTIMHATSTRSKRPMPKKSRYIKVWIEEG